VLRLNEDDCMSAVNGGGVERCVVQEYIDKPLLIGGFKSHLRLYAVITSTDPLRVYIYDDGVLQLATDKYLTPAADNLVSGQWSVVSQGSIINWRTLIVLVASRREGERGALSIFDALVPSQFQLWNMAHSVMDFEMTFGVLTMEF